MGTMVHPLFVTSSMRGLGPRSSSLSNLRLSGKLPKAEKKLCKLPPILEPSTEACNEGSFQAMERNCKSVPNLHRPESRDAKEERTGCRRSADPFYDFLHGSPFKTPSSNSMVQESEIDTKSQKVTKASIQEELRRIRQDDRIFKQDVRSLQSKSKHEGVIGGGVSLLHGDMDAKQTLSWGCKANTKLESLPTAKNEVQKLQELMKKQHRELGFLDTSQNEQEADKDFRSAFKLLLK